ncbi:glycosyltransferase [Romeriopsis navalis]|nr:glycosyltransferase [Romeriopsis navalis]
MGLYDRSKNQPRQAIALISDYSDPALIDQGDGCGQNVYVRQVGEALSQLGWQVDMFTRKASPDDAPIVEHNPHCRTIRLVAGPEEFVHRDELMEHMPAFIQAFQKFQTKGGSHYPLIHTNYWLSGWAGLKLKQHSNVQLIHTYHSFGVVKYETGSKPACSDLRIQTEREVLENAHCVVATSPQEERLMRSLISTKGRVQVIPGGADLDTFRAIPKGKARKELGFEAQEKIVLYVGRFDPRGGLETLVRAFAQLSQAGTEPLKLLIVGDGDTTPEAIREQQRIKAQVEQLGITASVTFVGAVGHDILPLYYTAADICAIPSYDEPFGLVAIEAMACGTPVVASAVGGLRFTVLPEETGLLVEPQNVDELATAIERIFSDEVWSQKMRKQATERVQRNFSWAAAGAQLSDLYRRLLAQSLSGDLRVS